MGYREAMDMIVGKPASGQIKVGDVFYTSWGYDQTNIDMVQVVSVSPSGKTVMVRMMSKRVARSEAGGRDYVVPHKASGESFRLMVRTQLDGRVSLAGSYPFAEGSKRMGHFYPYQGTSIYETALGWGH